MELKPAMSDEQRVYARWLDWTARVGFAALAGAFLLYALGVVEPHIPLARLPELWSLPLDRYRELTGAPSGWHWWRYLDKSESHSLIGVGLLALATLVCYLRFGILLLRRREFVPAAIVGAQVLVLLAAAANLFSGGH
jgi:hypothetical protein